MTAELGLTGRAGDQRLRARVIAGFERPSAMRLEAVAAGQVMFILAVPNQNATLLLPRDNQVLRNQRPEDILAALTGVNLGPADLQAILTGCVLPNARATGGRLYARDWASIELGSPAVLSAKAGSTIFLQRQQGGWRLRAARRSGWRIDYPEWQGQFPASVRLLSEMQPTPVDLTATISQLDTNVDLGAEAFAVNIPPGASPVTLDELRRSGPLRGP